MQHTESGRVGSCHVVSCACDVVLMLMLMLMLMACLHRQSPILYTDIISLNYAAVDLFVGTHRGIHVIRIVTDRW